MPELPHSKLIFRLEENPSDCHEKSENEGAFKGSFDFEEVET